MEIGAQLYTIRMYTQTERDFAFSMEKIADMGYCTVQLSAIGAGITPQAARRICDGNGLRIVLTHTDPNRILNDTARVIEEHEILGCDYIGIGAMPEKYRAPEWLAHFADDFQKPAEQIAAAGKLLMYHNHNFEFEKLALEKEARPLRIMEYLMREFAPDRLGFTLDTYWVQAAGGDVLWWIAQLAERIPCVHLKDMTVRGFEQRMAPVLEGNMNFPAILRALEKTSCRYALVEQDTCEGSPFDCLQTSCENLAALGYR